ncbi:DUF2782 domain-containing protein [Noviherbaspirillum sp. ST9]|uniref:DUF2782 domain-containing protein n=1 Tax=Noviherbaspirillum sp. ST9 TaxID=3401606 RepID=UPI003B5880DE
MCTNKAWRLIIAGIAIQAISLAASAQQPPKLEKLEEGEAPAVTIRKPDQKSRIQEKRAPGGKVTEVKVTAGGSSYVVKPNESAGSAQPGDLQSNTIRPAQWEVKEFDLGRPKTKEQEEAQAADIPVPPEAPAKK